MHAKRESWIFYLYIIMCIPHSLATYLYYIASVYAHDKYIHSVSHHFALQMRLWMCSVPSLVLSLSFSVYLFYFIILSPASALATLLMLAPSLYMYINTLLLWSFFSHPSCFLSEKEWSKKEKESFSNSHRRNGKVYTCIYILFIYIMQSL